MSASKMQLPPLSQKTCGECASPIPTDHPGGLCAKCLLKAGLPDSFPGASILNAGARSLVPPPEFPFLLGNYRILSLLGRGGMGAVYEAEHLETGRRLALKILSQTLDLPEARKRFLREGLLAASINHPNCVYIFGTEEIDGHPVIAMELVPGGTTLRDRIRSKPLPPKEAVDAILQVIAGLEAAHAKGIVHRDLKPTNCFVAPDGTVKVGDFGLSVSTLAADETHVTASGHILGTPAYASPEQLRGRSLDLRSDIYSLGATLFSLLTGRPPFEANRAVEVVAAVLETSPRNPSQLASEIPHGLAKIVLRCLAKRPEERFANYHELREALLPFSSCVPDPAPITLRLAAGIIDALIFWAAAMFLYQASQLSPTLEALGTELLCWVFVILYDCLFEGLWGASLGKRLLGLRVSSNQGGSPGLWRAAKRCVLFRAPTWLLPTHLLRLIHAGPSSGGLEFLLTFNGAWLLARGLSFLPLLRRNRRAGFHDLWSGTSVTLATSHSPLKAPANPPSQTTPPPPPNAEHIGPFRILHPLSAAWFLAFDDSLQRPVWIHCPPLDSPALPTARTGLARKTRLRWISGGRSPQQAWDAFDAPEGCPLIDLPKQPWEKVRVWLSDLTDEFALGSRENSLPDTVSLAHIWITPRGQALLLDEPAPRTPNTPNGPHSTHPLSGLRAFQMFLAEFTDACLDPDGLPLHAHDFLHLLRNASFENQEFLQGQLLALLKKPTRVSTCLKGVLLASAPVFFLGITLMFGIGRMVGEFQIKRRWAVHPEIRSLEASAAIAGFNQSINMFFLMHDFSTEEKPSKRNSREVLALRFLTAKFAPLILNPESDHTLPLSLWNPHTLEQLRKAIRAHRPVSPSELEEAARVIEPYIEKCVSKARSLPSYPKVLEGTHGGLGVILAVTALLQLLSVLAIRNPLGAQLCGLCILGPDGQRATRRRLLLRWLGAWGSLSLPWLALLLPDSPLRVGLISALDLVVLTYVAAFILRTKPRLHETLSQTRLVRR